MQNPPPNQPGYNNPSGAPPPNYSASTGPGATGGKTSMGLDANIAALLSYVLEVFGENSLGDLEILGLLALSALLLTGYGINAMHNRHPLLLLGLFHLRTFRASVVGSFFSRLGLGGIPFLFPLLYQIGLGYSAVQSGLLVMPQAMAAMGLKMIVPKILARFGYRTVLVGNTLILGILISIPIAIVAGPLYTLWIAPRAHAAPPWP